MNSEFHDPHTPGAESSDRSMHIRRVEPDFVVEEEEESLQHGDRKPIEVMSSGVVQTPTDIMSREPKPHRS